MTGETLLPCWSCGSADLHIYGGHRGRTVQCHGCGLRGALVSEWQARALAPALDRVIAEVEARHGPHPVRRKWHAFHSILLALRAEQSADAGGERGGGL